MVKAHQRVCHNGERFAFLSSDGFAPGAGMNSLSKFCIAVSATRKLNCVAVGVICVAVFFGVLEKKILELHDAFPAQPVQAILKKKIVLPLQR